MISVVIPARNAAACLPDTLAAIEEGRGAGLVGEVIVSDGWSDDATRALARAAGARVVEGPPSRGGQIARGAAVAGGEWLMLLHADSRLQPGWARVVRAHLPSGVPAAFRLAFASRAPAARFVAGWANLRSRLLGLPYGDQGLILPRTMFEASGGVPEIPLMEDVALVRRLPVRPRLLPHRVITSAERYEAEGWLRRGARNLVLLARFLAGADPQLLARAYRRRR